MQDVKRGPERRLAIGEARGWKLLAELGEPMEMETFQQIHVARGNDEPNCYVVLSGILAVKKLRPDRESMVVGLRTRGALLFERHALVETNRKDLYFEALCPAKLKRIPRHELHQAVTDDPKLSAILADSLFAKLAGSIDQFEDAHTRTVKERLTSLLQELAVFSRDYERGAEWVHVEPKLSRQDYGDLLAANRVTVAKALNSLKKEGVVATKGRRIYISRDVLE